MKILFPTIHDYLSRSFSRSFKELGHDIIIPTYRASAIPPHGSDFIWNSSMTDTEIKHFYHNAVPANLEQIIDLKPDVLFINTFENQFEILQNIKPHLPNAKIVAYSGNDYWDGAYDFNTIKNYIPLDNTGKFLARKYQVNYIDFFPWIFYDNDPFMGNESLDIQKNKDSKTIGTYIFNYKKLFNDAYNLYESITKKLNFNFILHDQTDLWNYIKDIKKSFCTLHIKPLEGFGYSIVESMACGKPVLVYTPYSQGKAYNQFLYEGVTGFRFSNMRELTNKINFIYENQYEISEQCGNKIRQIINNEEQTQKLHKFLENLI